MKQYFVYILKCSDDSYYIGVTSDLENRLLKHQSGHYPESYTHNRRPVELVFYSEFNEIEQAIAFEKQVKGWSRKKKEAIINDNWEKLKELSICQNNSHSDNFNKNKGFDSAQPDNEKKYMQHLKNIQTLFSKNFVENPLLETFEVGKLHLSSGYLVANDPLLTPDKQAFTVKFPIGDFTTFIHKERESNCIAYAEVVFANQEVDYWEMAVCEGQNIKDLKDEEIFGYPVESGMGCFMDLDSQNLLNNLEIELFKKKGNDFLGIYEEFFHQHFYDENGAIDQFAFLKPYDNKPNNIFAFEAGFGEGFYACYIGFDEQKNPVKIIAEFIEVKSE